MTPGYAIKHSWRKNRNPGESLRQYALRQLGDGHDKAAATKWFRNKRSNPRK